ncbi:MAG: redoxin family protein [Phycisphaerae bacterium]|nr:redoxin family protein [Phycisphaerae bacterium]
MTRRLLLAASILLAPASAVALAGEPSSAAASESTRLTIGEPAPALTIDKWVRGESIPSFEKGKVYVIEFWATWCGPCVRAMPHLTELSKQHRDVTFVAVTKPDKRNTLEKVEEMVKAKNADGLMHYTVAWDESKSTTNAYMTAANQRGIPCAFVVDKESRIAFIGHPMELDAALEGVTKGTWNLADAKAAYEAEYEKEAKRNAFFEAMDKDDTAGAYSIADSLISNYFKDDPGTLNAIAWTIVDPDGEVTDKNLDIAMRAAKRAVELDPKDAGILDTLARVHFLKGEVAVAIRTQEEAISHAKDADMKADLQETLDEYKAAGK